MKNIAYILLFVLVGCTTVNCPTCPEQKDCDSITYKDSIIITKVVNFEDSVIYHDSTIYYYDTSEFCLDTAVFTPGDFSEQLKAITQQAEYNWFVKKQNDSARTDLLLFQDSLNRYAVALNTSKHLQNAWVQNKSSKLDSVYRYKSDSLNKANDSIKNELIAWKSSEETRIKMLYDTLNNKTMLFEQSFKNEFIKKGGFYFDTVTGLKWCVMVFDSIDHPLTF